LSQFNFDSLNFSRFLYNTPISDIIEDQSGVLWITTFHGLASFEPGTERFTFYQHHSQDPKSLSSNILGTILEDSRGNLWIAASNGLNRMDRDSATFTHFQYDSTDPFSLSSDEVTDILEDSRGRLWFATLNGLNLFDPSTEGFIHIQHDPSDPFSLSDNLISTIFEDQSGVLWIGTISGGLNKLSASSNRFSSYPQVIENPDENLDLDQVPELEGLKNAVILDVFEDSDESLWIGTIYQGLYKINRGSGEVFHFQHDPDNPLSLSSNGVNAIYEDSSGDIWIGSSGGLDQFDLGSQSFRHHPTFQKYSVEDITEDAHGDLLVGTSGGLFRLFPSSEGELLNEYHRLDPSYPGDHYITDIYTDSVGSIWVSTATDGIFVLHPGETDFTHLSHNPEDSSSLGSDSISYIYEDQQGVIWIGTILGGLNRFDRASGTFTQYTESDGLAGDWVTCIQVDEEGDLWLATNRGVTEFNSNTGDIYNFDSWDGLQGGEVISCAQGDQGQMYFGGLQGLNSFYPEQIEINLQPPPMVITAVNLFNQAIRTDLSDDEHIQLPYDENFISFDYAALDYNTPEKNQYAYLLEGLDQEWVYAGSRRHAEYPNLEPGEYIFRVKGSNNDGIWNETGMAVNISIQPPFWSTLWFQGMVIVVLIGAAVGSYQWRVRSLQSRSRELENQVEERTSELEVRTLEAEQQRKEIEALYLADEELHRYLHMDQVLEALLETAVDILQGDKAVLMVWDQEHEQLVTHATVGFTPDTVSSMSFAPLEGLAGYVVDTGEPVIIDDFASDPSSDLHIYEAEGIRTFMMVPIKISGEIFGVFSVAYLKIHRFTDQEQRLLIALAQRAALAIENARLYEQSKELASIQERNRIARDLHDSVTQSLFGVNMYADAAENFLTAGKVDLAAENLTKLGRTARDALGQMRYLIYRLRPPILEEEGLVAALEARLDTVESRAGLETKLELTGIDELPKEVENELYSIAIEALNNTLKHANAEHVLVIMNQKDGTFHLEITDDGSGFDLESAKESGGLGLLGMQERVAQLGGQFKIESQPGQGTRIYVTVELNQ
jgi:signal transduction histidine kinase/streptogramin lyase